MVPALFTSTSMAPQALSTPLMSASTSSARVTSPWKAIASPPWRVIASTTSWAASSRAR